MTLSNISVTNTFTEQMVRLNQVIFEMNKVTDGEYISSGNVKFLGTSTSGDIVANVDGTARVTTLQLKDGSVTYPSLTRAAASNVGIYFPSTNTMSLVAASNDVVYLTAAGNVAVGRTHANAKLDVNGTLLVSGRTVINANVGINKAEPAYALDVVGSIWATGDINMESDARVKEDIVPLSGALEAVLGMNGVTYRKKATQKQEIGLIAQEVEAILPTLVSTNGNLSGINYQGIIAVLIEAIKTLSKRIDELET